MPWTSNRRACRPWTFASVLALMSAWPVCVPAQAPNPSFEEGANAPTAWSLSKEGSGAWEREGRSGKRSLSVTGDGKDSNFWKCEAVAFKPGEAYRVTFYTRTDEGAAGGSIVSGPTFANRDYNVGQEWERKSFVFKAPKDVRGAFLRFGQWMKKGKVWFDDVSLASITPKHAQLPLYGELGDEERVKGGVYTFQSRLGAPHSNYARACVEHTAGFNSDRWTFSDGAYVLYKFQAGKFSQTAATLTFNVNHYTNGECIAEASRDGAAWQPLDKTNAVGTKTVALPNALFPADALYIRFRATGGLQVNNIKYQAKLAGNPPDAQGDTWLVEVLQKSAKFDVTVESLGDLQPGGQNTVSLKAKNHEAAVKALCVTLEAGTQEAVFRTRRLLSLQPGGEVREQVGYEVGVVPDQEMRLTVSDVPSGQVVYLARVPFTVSALYAHDFGYAVRDDSAWSLWWAEGTYKVSRVRGVPWQRASAVEIGAARNEYEPFQLVLRPKRPLKNVTLTVSDLKSKDGGAIPASNVSVNLVEYVNVEIPTDSFGCVGEWPDPLPPLEKSLDLKPDLNQPLWLTVYVPETARADLYEGQLQVTADGLPAVQIPLRLKVWDFVLPKETHTKTAYGVSVDTRFLGLKSREDILKVHELYMQNCAAHRIAPYSPMAHAPVKWDIAGPKLVIDAGPASFTCDQLKSNLAQIAFSGTHEPKALGALRCTLTTFEKQGIGYQGTGVGWPSAERIKSLDLKVKEPRKGVVEMVVEKNTSAECSRKFEAGYRLTFYPGQACFKVQLLYLKNTDTVPYRVNNYFHILPPSQDSTAHNAEGYAAWLGKDAALGAFELSPQSFRFGLFRRDTAYHGDIARDLGVQLAPGQVFNAPQPELVVFAIPLGTAEAVKTEVTRLKPLVGQGDALAAGELKYSDQREGKVTHEFTDFDRAARRYLDEFRFNAFNFGFGGVPAHLGGYPRLTPEYNRLHKQVFGPIAEHLRQNGWLDKAYCYWFDEPEEKDYPTVIEGMKLLKENCPGLARLLTEQPEPPLYDHVDIWVPVLSNYKEDQAKQRQAAGQQVWWYVCCGPHAPYPNNFIDHPAINHRIRFWMMQKYGVTGSLYWSTTYYRGAKGVVRNPWTTAMSYSPEGGTWGNGDGMLLYPPCREPSDKPVVAGPINSIRWELLREGLEDREYFWLLEQRLKAARAGSTAARHGASSTAAVAQAEAAIRSLHDLIRSLTDYERDPAKLHAARAKLAEAIEALVPSR